MTLLVSRPPFFIILCGWTVIILLFIMQYHGILMVWLPGTAQIINKKEVWLAFQGNNEGRSGMLKHAGSNEKLIFMFVWPKSRLAMQVIQ